MYSEHGVLVTNILKKAGLRPTRQRVMLGKLLWPLDGTKRHVTAEQLHQEVHAEGAQVSLATVYNTLHQFTDCGLLGEVTLDGSKAYFDTNIDPHHHFLYVDSGELIDIPEHQISFDKLPEPPCGGEPETVDVIIRMKGQSVENSSAS